MLKRLARTGLRKGVLGGSRPWLLVGVTAFGLRLLGRVVRNEPEVLYCDELSPGGAVLVTLRDDDGRPEVQVTPAR
jgi:hypothetical protein